MLNENIRSDDAPLVWVKQKCIWQINLTKLTLIWHTLAESTWFSFSTIYKVRTLKSIPSLHETSYIITSLSTKEYNVCVNVCMQTCVCVLWVHFWPEHQSSSESDEALSSKDILTLSSHEEVGPVKRMATKTIWQMSHLQAWLCPLGRSAYVF